MPSQWLLTLSAFPKLKGKDLFILFLLLYFHVILTRIEKYSFVSLFTGKWGDLSDDSDDQDRRTPQIGVKHFNDYLILHKPLKTLILDSLELLTFSNPLPPKRLQIKEKLKENSRRSRKRGFTARDLKVLSVLNLMQRAILFA